MVRRRIGQQGFVFLSGLVLSSSLLVFLSIGAIRSMTELSASERYLAKQRAFYLAEGRMDEALALLAADFTMVGNCAVAAEPAYGTSTCTITDPGDGTRVINTSGTVLGVLQTLQGVAAPQSAGPFQWALFAREDLHIWGKMFNAARSVIDSYDSTGGPGAGAHQATVQMDDPTGTFVIGFGNTAFGWGGLDLYGDAVIGQGGDPNAGIIDSTNFPAFSGGVVHGTKKAATAPTSLPTILPPSGSPEGGVLNWCPADPIAVPTDDVSSIILPAGCTLTLVGDGVLQLDDLDIGIGSMVRIEGDVALSTSTMELRSGAVFSVASGSAAVYVNGPLNTTYGDSRFINVTQDPKNLTLYLQGPQAVVLATLGGSAPAAPFYGAVYAPDGVVELMGLGGEDFYGSFVAQLLGIFHDTNIHYDVSLKNLLPSSSGGSMSSGGSVTLSSWQQL